MALIWQSTLGVLFTFALYAPVVNTVGPRPEPMIVWPEQRVREDEDDGGPNGGLKFSPGCGEPRPGLLLFRNRAILGYCYGGYDYSQSVDQEIR